MKVAETLNFFRQWAGVLRHVGANCAPRRSAGSPVPNAAMKPIVLVIVVAAMVLAAGCGPTKQELAAREAVGDYFRGDFEASRVILRKLALETNENFALNNVRLGSASLIDYHLDEAEAAFLRAYEVMNSVGVNQGGRTAGATLIDEKIKVWKGEPFERAMTNYYLGVVYYIKQDYENARAAFENALFKLREYGDKKDGVDAEDYTDIESNFALGYLMLAKSWVHLWRDDLAQANFTRAVALNPELAGLADLRLNQQSNVLLIVDYGSGPRFVRSEEGSTAGFRPTPDQVGPVPAPQVRVDNVMYRLNGLDRPPVDMLALAQEKRWQSIDTIRVIKSVVGTGLVVGGAGYGAYRASRGRLNSQDVLISGAMIGTGLLLRQSSKADVRQWEMLPRSSFVIALKLPPGRHDIAVRFGPTDFASDYEQTWLGIEAPAQGEATYYLRMRRWANGPFLWADFAVHESQAVGLNDANPTPTTTAIDQ